MPEYIKRVGLRREKNGGDSFDIGVESAFSRIPYFGLTARDYEIPDDFGHLEKELESHILRLPESGFDAGCGGAADPLIEAAAVSSAEKLAAQRAEHVCLIGRISDKLEGSALEARRKLADYRRELARVDAKIAQLEGLVQAEPPEDEIAAEYPAAEEWRVKDVS